MKGSIISVAAVALFAAPLFASAQTSYAVPNHSSSYGPQYQPVVVYAPHITSAYQMQQQQQQMAGAGYGSVPGYMYAQPSYTLMPYYGQLSYQPVSYRYGSYYQPGQYVPNYYDYVNQYGGYDGHGSYATPGYYGTPNPYTDQGYFTGGYDTLNAPICYFPSYGSADCGSDPREPVYDVWSGTWY